MRSFLDIHNTGDLRHLLYDFNSEVDVDLLVPIYEKIISEYVKLSGNDGYYKFLQKKDIELWDDYVIRAITITINCVQFGFNDLAKNMIQEFNLKIKIDKKNTKNTISQLERKIKSITNKYKVKALNQRKQETKESTWGEMQVYIHRIIGVMPHFDCTVEQYTGYKNVANQKIAAQSQ